MKIIIVILVLIQISLIVPNPNNIESEQKESKGIGRNLNHQRRLGFWDSLKNFGNKIYNVKQKIVDKVKDVFGVVKEIGGIYYEGFKIMKNGIVYVVKKVPEVANAVRTGAKIVVNEVKIGFEKGKEYVKNIFK